MYENLIKEYIENKLTKGDIKNYCNKKNITINNDEINIVYEVIKNKWKTLYKGCEDDKIKIFEYLKTNLNDNLYNNIVDLYNEYKKKIN